MLYSTYRFFFAYLLFLEKESKLGTIDESYIY